MEDPASTEEKESYRTREQRLVVAWSWPGVIVRRAKGNRAGADQGERRERARMVEHGHLGDHPADADSPRGAQGPRTRQQGLPRRRRALGVRVNAIAPGYMLSEMTRQFTDANPDLARQWTDAIPIGRMGGPRT